MNKKESGKDLYKQGWEYFNQKEYQKSIRKLSNAIDLNANDPDYFKLRGMAYCFQKNYDKAIDDASKAIDLNSDDPEYFDLRGTANLFLANYDKAIEDETKAINLNSENPEYFKVRGWAYYYLKNYDIAIEEATKAIDLNSEDAEYFHLRSRAYYDLNNYDKAIEEATKAIDLNSEDPSYEIRGWAYYYLKNYDKAIEDANKAIDLNSDDPDIFFLKEDSLKRLHLGKIYEYFNNEDYEKTIIQCNKEISSNNLIPEFFSYRGLAKWNSDKVHKNKSILEDFDTAIRMDPENGDFYRYRGELKLEIDLNGNYIKEAIDDLDLAIHLNEKDLHAFFTRAQAKFIDNDYEDSLMDIEQVFRLDPNDEFGYHSKMIEIKSEINDEEIGLWGYIYLIENRTSKNGTHRINTTNNIEIVKKNLNGDLLILNLQCTNHESLKNKFYKEYNKQRIGRTDNFNFTDFHVGWIIQKMNDRASSETLPFHKAFIAGFLDE